jgi:hypothetical protein
MSHAYRLTGRGLLRMQPVKQGRRRFGRGHAQLQQQSGSRRVGILQRESEDLT